MDSEAVDEVAGPLLKPLGVDGVPLMAVGEWLLPFIIVWGVKECRVVPWDAEGGGGGMLGGVERGCVFTSAGESGIAAAFFSFLSTAGPPFLGPRGAEQLVDAAGSLLSNTRDAWDMELEVDPGD